MKKGLKLLLSLAFVAVIITGITSNVKAAGETATVTTSTVEVDKVNTQQTIKVDFDTHTNKIEVLDAMIYWDSTKGTLVSATGKSLDAKVKDHPTMAGYKGVQVFHFIDAFPDTDFTATLIFKNILASATAADEFRVFTVLEPKAGTDEVSFSYDYVGGEFISYKNDQVTMVDGGVSYTPTPLPIGVTISPKTADVVQGETKQFSTTVTNATDTTVAYSITGQKDAGTTIDAATGLLTVSAKEAAGTKITVKATSNAISDTAIVTVKEAPAIPVHKLTMTPETAVVKVGGTVDFKIVSENGTYSTALVGYKAQDIVDGVPVEDAAVVDLGTTALGADGKLIVDANVEIGTAIFVFLTSEVDNSIVASAYVVVVSDSTAELLRVDVLLAKIDETSALLKDAEANPSKYTKESVQALIAAYNAAYEFTYGELLGLNLTRAMNNQDKVDFHIKALTDTKLILASGTTPVVPGAPGTGNVAGGKVTETGVSAPIMAFVLIAFAGTSIIVRRKYTK